MDRREKSIRKKAKIDNNKREERKRNVQNDEMASNDWSRKNRHSKRTIEVRGKDIRRNGKKSEDIIKEVNIEERMITPENIIK